MAKEDKYQVFGIIMKTREIRKISREGLDSYRGRNGRTTGLGRTYKESQDKGQGGAKN